MSKEVLIGDTVKITWVSSGTTMSPATTVIYNGSETAVSSISMTSSGNGHYYANYTVPDSAQWMVAETVMVTNSFPYKRRTKFRVVRKEVD